MGTGGAGAASPVCGEVLRGALAEINLDAISSNLEVVKRVAGNRPVIAVVKADAYGHGAVEISKRLADDGAAYLAVAFTGEAITLREAGISSAILVLFDKCDVDIFFEYDLIPVVHDLASAKRFSKEAVRRGRSLDVHLKFDTGMGRLGLRTEDMRKDIAAIAKLSRLNIKGLMSHFSDSDVADQSYAEAQVKSFVAIRNEVLAASPAPVLCHMANSAATLSLKEAHFDAVRPGLVLYGHSPFQPPASGLLLSEDGKKTKVRLPRVNLVPAMTVKTEILSLRRVRSGMPISYGRTFITKRDSLIAVLPVGYADGYHRALSNNMDVLVKGKRAPVVGRVCMDLIMVDVTEVKGLREKDEVVLLGRQGTAEIMAAEMAGRAGTISYEILTSIGRESRKVYVQSGLV